MASQPFFYPAAIISLLSIPLVFSLVPRNCFYGVRTPKTLADEQVWNRANRFGGWLFLVSGAVYLMFATLYPMSSTRDPRFTLWLAHLVMFALPLLVSVIWTILYCRRL